MKRHELEHLIRAAGAITGADEIIVIVESRIAALPGDAADLPLLLARWQRIRMTADHTTRK